MKPTLKNKEPDVHKELHFRDRSAIVSRVLIVMAAVIFGGATFMLSWTLRQSMDRQAEMKQLIGLTEAQGGNITMARQIYDVMKKISVFSELPEDELPVFATIADVAKLQDQAIFKQALNGDQILFYTKAQKIFIYRPTTNVLVAQGPFVLANPNMQTQPTAAPTSSVPTVTLIPSPQEASSSAQ